MFSIAVLIDWDESMTTEEARVADARDLAYSLLDGNVELRAESNKISVKYESVLTVLDGLYKGYCLSLLTQQGCMVEMTESEAALEITVGERKVSIVPNCIKDASACLNIREEDYLSELRKVFKETFSEVDEHYPGLVKSLNFLQCFPYSAKFLTS